MGIRICLFLNWDEWDLGYWELQTQKWEWENPNIYHALYKDSCQLYIQSEITLGTATELFKKVQTDLWLSEVIFPLLYVSQSHTFFSAKLALKRAIRWNAELCLKVIKYCR